MRGVAVGLDAVALLSVADGDQMYDSPGVPAVAILYAVPAQMIVSGEVMDAKGASINEIVIESMMPQIDAEVSTMPIVLMPPGIVASPVTGIFTIESPAGIITLGGSGVKSTPGVAEPLNDKLSVVGKGTV